MKYETHEFLQGSTDWLAHRDLCYNGSDIDAARGESPYKTRGKLIHNLATGDKEEVTPEMQQRFDDGHIFEDLARPLAEEEIGEELYPEVLSAVVEGLGRRLSSSLDGKTMSDKINWEHKTLNAALAESLDQGIIPEQYHGQMEQGMLLNGAERCLFSASKWKRAPGNETVEGTIYGYYVMPDETTVRYALVDIKHQWYESNPELRASIIPIWKQIEKEVDEHKPVEVIPAAVATPTLDLPIVSIQTSGAISIVSNLRTFGTALQVFIDRLPTNPSTDQEFADCKAACAKFKLAEEKLDTEETRALSQIGEVDEMRREKKLYQDLCRSTRLALEKLIVAREAAIKVEIMQKGKDELAAHIAGLNKRLARVQMPAIEADWKGAIKSKRTVASLKEAVNTLLANKLIEASAIADKIQINLNILDENKEYSFLFSDIASLAMKSPDDLANTIRLRIADHKAAEEKRLEAERERIRKEEAEKLAKEAAAKAPSVVPEAPVMAQPMTTEEKTVTPAMARPVASETTNPAEQHGDIAWVIGGLIAEMDDDEKQLVLHYCERIIEQRLAAA